MALHNPILEAAARVLYAFRSGEYVTRDYCRHWCANNKAQALAALHIAAGQIDTLRAENLLPEASQIARPLSEWHEGLGDVLWWKSPFTEPPYVGTPLDLGFTVELHTQDGPEPRIAARGTVGGWPGYHTHFTPLPSTPMLPKQAKK